MRKQQKTAMVLLTALVVVFACGCTKPDEPNNGGNSGNGGENGGGGQYNGNYEYVDLGLPSGTLWATFNVGAAKPEDVGDRFQWGETTPNHSGRNKYYIDGSANDDDSGWTKYCWSEDGIDYGYHGYTDNLRVLEPSDDAATVNWGNEWVTPTRDQWAELFENTPYIMTTQNGVYGCQFTASNGNTLFLPDDGDSNSSDFNFNPNEGYYWTSSHVRQYGDSPSHAWSCKFWHIDSYHGDSYSVYFQDHRSHLLCVRPVVNRDGSLNGHDYVDLGLPSGTLWATCNVGSNTPEGYGDYFAWGETEAKSTYERDNYKHCNEVVETGYNNNPYIVYKLTKYCSNSILGYNGFVDNKTILEAEDDAAIIRWGNEWCMPTYDQWNELNMHTSHQWTTQNGVSGRVFVGSNGKSIFLPASGYKQNELNESTSNGYYWANSLQNGEDWRASLFMFDLNGAGAWIFINYDYGKREFGYSVRPVRSNQQK